MVDGTDKVGGVVAMISYEDPVKAIEWLEKAFGFKELGDQRYTQADGSIGHAELATGAGSIALAGPLPDYQNPKRHRENCEAAARWSRMPWVIDGVQVSVAAIDEHFATAQAAGASMLSEIEENPYGRLYRAEDIEGHRWMFFQLP